jgi:hypothetical protein
VILTWPLAQALLEQSRAKLEFLHREQGSWGRRSEEARRTTTAEARLVDAQQRVADLNGEMADLRIRHEEAVTDSKETGEKLLALIERARKDQEEAQKVKNESDELCGSRSSSSPSLNPSTMSVSMLLVSAMRLAKNAS